jgi:hypothetical protein
LGFAVSEKQMPQVVEIFKKQNKTREQLEGGFLLVRQAL